MSATLTLSIVQAQLDAYNGKDIEALLNTYEVRAVELDGHPFFVATLFQSERASLAGAAAPLVVSFVKACAA